MASQGGDLTGSVYSAYPNYNNWFCYLSSFLTSASLSMYIYKILSAVSQSESLKS